MGMAASQARLLTITSRLHDVEYNAQNIESQKIQLSEQEYNILKIVEDLKNIISSDIKAKNHTLDVDVSSIQNPNVLCDRLRLDQILLNLLGNALKWIAVGVITAVVTVVIIRRKRNRNGYYNNYQRS